MGHKFGVESSISTHAVKGKYQPARICMNMLTRDAARQYPDTFFSFCARVHCRGWGRSGYRSGAQRHDSKK